MTGTVLIIEDDEAFSAEYARRLPGYTVVRAYTHWEARALYMVNIDNTVGIIMDGALGGTELNTLELIRWIRRTGFTGTMIAASASSDYRDLMVVAGCTRGIGKRELARALPGVFE